MSIMSAFAKYFVLYSGGNRCSDFGDESTPCDCGGNGNISTSCTKLID